MGVTISLPMDIKIRKDMHSVANQSSDGIINLIFDYDSLTLLGYSNSAFCMCDEYVECQVKYNFRVQAGIMLALTSCARIEFDINATDVMITGYNKDDVLKRQVKIKINTDTTANYQADLYKDLINNLRAGFSCDDLLDLKQFEKISRVADKAERGVIISDHQYYTCGTQFKFYGSTKLDFNCFLLSDDLKRLIEFANDEQTVLYEKNGYIISKNANGCYLGIRTAVPSEALTDIERVLKQKSEMKFEVPIAEMKADVRSIKTSKLDEGVITFLPEKNELIISMNQVIFRQPLMYTNIEGELSRQLKFNFKIFNSLIQTMSTQETARFTVFQNFVSVVLNNHGILLIARDNK